MNLVLPGLYVGSLRDAIDGDQMDTNGITHVISLLIVGKPRFPNRHYLCIKIIDALNQNISQYFKICNDFIHRARSEDSRNNNVLVHCYLGYSRSVSICMAYLMTVAELSFQDAYELMRHVRVGARPNLAFQMQLREFEKRRAAAERWRFRQVFPSTDLQTLDRLRCLKKLDDLKRLRVDNENFASSSHNTPGEENTENEQRDSIHNLNISGMIRTLRIWHDVRHGLDPRRFPDEEGFEKEILMPNAIYYRPFIADRNTEN